MKRNRIMILAIAVLTPMLLLSQESKNRIAVVKADLSTSISDGTRLVVTEKYNSSSASWQVTGKTIRIYKNSHVVKNSGSFGWIDYLYNDNNQQQGSEQFNYGVLTWKFVFKYTPEGKLKNAYGLYNQNNNLDSVNNNIYTIDENGRVLEAFQQLYSAGTWINQSHSVNTYDGSGNRIRLVHSSWDGNKYIDTNLDSSIYTNNLLTESYSKSYSSGNWIPLSKTLYAYDGSNDITQTMKYNWDNINKVWFLTSRDTYSTLPGKYIVLFSPQTSSTYYASDSLVISWYSSGVSATDIQLSSDNKSSWSAVKNNIVGSDFGFYTFRNTNITSNNCYIRVSETSNFSVYDQSSNSFQLNSFVPFLTHETGTVKLSVFSSGEIGANNGSIQSGLGFTYNGHSNPLYSAGVVVGTSVTGLYGSMRSFTINDLKSDTLDNFTGSQYFDQIAKVGFTLPAAPDPINKLFIQQTTYSKKGNDYVFCIYKITNNSISTEVTGLNVGMMADWDIYNSSTNLGAVVSEKKLVYQYNQNGTGDPNYYGMVSLNNFSGGMVTNASFNSSSRLIGMSWISTVFSESITSTGDQRSFIGSGSYTIPANSSVQVGFALVGASSLANLKLQTDTLIQTWDNGILTNIESEKVIQQSFNLHQNYPNPFNPSTVIEYELRTASFVKLSVFDILGREIKVLVDGDKPAGSYKAEFNAGNLSSGVYFYQLSAKDFIQTKKFILVR